MKHWGPRASSLGAYMLCEYRAACDRLVYEGQVPSVERGQSSGYAELGTIIHYALQRHLNAEFHSAAEPPTPADEAAAILLCGGAPELATTVGAVVAAAASAMPKTPDGERWLAEYAFRKGGLGGHLDFLSKDRTTLVDLKTTGRKPDHGRMKGEHFIQMCAYKLLVPTVTTAHVLYVDSTKGNWTLLCTAKMDTQEVTDFLDLLSGYIRRMRAKSFVTSAVPRPGSHCASTFCPYASACRDVLIPGPGTLWERGMQSIKTSEVL